MQTKNVTRLRKLYKALLDLLLLQQCSLRWRFCFEHGLGADCWQGLVLLPRLFANAVGGHLPMPLEIIFASFVLSKRHPWAKSGAAFYMTTGHGT